MRSCRALGERRRRFERMGCDGKEKGKRRERLRENLGEGIGGVLIEEVKTQKQRGRLNFRGIYG